MIQKLIDCITCKSSKKNLANKELKFECKISNVKNLESKIDDDFAN